MFELTLDGWKKLSVENKKPVSLGPVKVFAGNNFVNPLDGKLRNIVLQSKRD